MQTLQNGIVVPTNSDPYNPTADLATMGLKSNVIIPVTTQAQRDALTGKFNGMTVRRIDLGGDLQWWNGTIWVGTPHAEFTTSNTAGTVIWGMGVFTRDTALSTDTTFVTIPGTDILRVRDAGIYSITVMVSFTNVMSGSSWLSVDGAYTVPMTAGLQNFLATMPNVKLAAGADIHPLLSQGTGVNQAFTSRVRVTRVA